MQTGVHHRAGKLHFFCPLCHYHQSTNTIARVKLRHHFQLAVLTGSVAALTWPFFGPKGLFLYFVFWLVFEVGYRTRKRQALICESCGFDPFLYKQDVVKARMALKSHWEKRIETENLFAGKKLRNYQTKPSGEASNAGQSGAAKGSAAENPPEFSL